MRITLVDRLDQSRSNAPENPYNQKENDAVSLHFYADEANGAVSGCSPGYTCIQTKITRAHGEDRPGQGNN